jgi:hypothetical protein
MRLRRFLISDPMARRTLLEIATSSFDVAVMAPSRGSFSRVIW